MSDDHNKLKLGKGSYFVKTRLRQLKQEDDTWETDFFPIPSSDTRVGGMWLGLVLSHAHDNVLAQYTVEEPPGVNDLARLLAEAMRRPLTPSAHRPRVLHLRNRAEWSELPPHLKQVGIQVVFRDVLPKWDDREEEHMYEFQLGQGPKDLQGPTYGPDGIGADQGGAASETTIDSLRLKVGRSFGYLFDFGDNWWHQINVAAVEKAVPDGKFPRVTKRVGKSPPQYPENEDDE